MHICISSPDGPGKTSLTAEKSPIGKLIPEGPGDGSLLELPSDFSKGCF